MTNLDLPLSRFFCPKCQQEMKKFQSGLQCTNKECEFWIPKAIRQRALNESIIKELTEKKQTSIINGFHKKGSSQTFSASLYIDENWKIRFQLPDLSLYSCPLCGFPLQHFSKGYRCINEDQCDFILWNRFCGKHLTEEDLTALLSEGQTSLISGFISKKNGRKFNAQIVMDPQGKLYFKFQ